VSQVGYGVAAGYRWPLLRRDTDRVQRDHRDRFATLCERESSSPHRQEQRTNRSRKTLILRSISVLDKRVYLLTTIAFVVGMVELIIGGILDLVALDLGVSVGSAGLLITVFAIVFGISGPVLLYLTGHADRKRV